MTALAAPRDALLPRPPQGMAAGALLALLVHAGLIVAIAFGVHWKASEPAGIEAELWASVPQIAAPQAVEPRVEPQAAPPAKVEPRTEPQPETPDPQIAREREKKERQKKLEEERERQEQAEKLAKAKAERGKLERDKREKAEREERLITDSREQQMRRMQELAGGTGAPTSPGTAAQTAGPSAGYAGRIKARIKPNIVFADSVPGNPVASVEVRAAADGTIVGRRLLRSSGVPAWDEAVLRAIEKTEILPRDTDGRVPATMIIDFRVRE